MDVTALSLPLVLVGLPGCGKSRVGAALAERLKINHLDTDTLVEHDAGMSIAEIFALEGETGFRDRELRAVTQALNYPAVVSLGGGAVTSQAVRDLLSQHTVIYIDSDHEELLRRIRRKNTRPLLRDNPGETLKRLRRERSSFYESVAQISVESDSSPVATVVNKILSTLDPSSLRVSVGKDPSYEVLIGRGITLPSVIAALPSSVVRALIIHPAAMSHQAHEVAGILASRGVSCETLMHPDGEAGKTIAFVTQAWHVAGKMHLGRRDIVIAVGGGVTTDVAGFVAATWLRGINVMHIPTTVLAMVDAAVGGKTGINTDAGKNLVGAFHSPIRVIADLDALVTLPETEVNSGFAEVVKCGLIADPKIVELLREKRSTSSLALSEHLPELVERTVKVKAHVVTEDLYESGLRETLNYGHTLAHAIEKCEGYSWRHGDAVAVGCVFAAELAACQGMLSEEDVSLHRELFIAVGLPVSYSGAPMAELVKVMRSDKKTRGDDIRYVLLDGLYTPVVRTVSTDELREPAMKVGIDVSGI